MIGRLLEHTQGQTTAWYAHIARDTARASAARIGDSIEQDMHVSEATPARYFRTLPFDPVDITCLAPPGRITEKVRACYQRSKARDIYDLSVFATVLPSRAG